MTVPTGAAGPGPARRDGVGRDRRPGRPGWARDLVGALGGDPHDVPDDARRLYHAGLAIGSNAAAAAVVVARQLLLAARVDDPAAFLGPLVERSVANALTDGARALTGPVVRGDVGTVARHLDALAADVPDLSAAYRDLSRVLLGRVRAGRCPAAAASSTPCSTRRAGGPVERLTTIAEVRAAVAEARATGRASRWCPTMGALHARPPRTGARGRSARRPDRGVHLRQPDPVRPRRRPRGLPA